MQPRFLVMCCSCNTIYFENFKCKFEESIKSLGSQFCCAKNLFYPFQSIISIISSRNRYVEEICIKFYFILNIKQTVSMFTQILCMYVCMYVHMKTSLLQSCRKLYILVLSISLQQGGHMVRLTAEVLHCCFWRLLKWNKC